MNARPENGRDGDRPPLLRRLDHVAIAVHDTEQALTYFRDTLGLNVAHVDELTMPPVTLTYLNAGNTYIQLVSPRGPCDIERWLAENGEGLHHICFAVDDVEVAVAALSGGSEGSELGSGRVRVAAFVHNGNRFGVRIECTEFHEGDGAALGPRIAE
jgi:methylmalonyl-CoA/ethylmalonyl-CoA epimerase